MHEWRSQCTHNSHGLGAERSWQARWMHVSHGLCAAGALNGCTTAARCVLRAAGALNLCTTAVGCVLSAAGAHGVCTTAAATKPSAASVNQRHSGSSRAAARWQQSSPAHGAFVFNQSAAHYWQPRLCTFAATKPGAKRASVNQLHSGRVELSAWRLRFIQSAALWQHSSSAHVAPSLQSISYTLAAVKFGAWRFHFK